MSIVVIHAIGQLLVVVDLQHMVVLVVINLLTMNMAHVV